MPPITERPSPAEQTASASLPAPAGAGQGVGTRSGFELFYRDARDLLVSPLFASSCAFLRRYSGHWCSGLVVGSPCFAQRCFVADALFPAQAMGALGWENVDDRATLARLVAVGISAPVNRFGVCGWSGTSQQHKDRSPQHVSSPFLQHGKSRMWRPQDGHIGLSVLALLIALCSLWLNLHTATLKPPSPAIEFIPVRPQA